MLLTFAARDITFISSKKFRLLLLLTPSVPSVTRIPRAFIAARSAMPDANFILLIGFVATETRFSARMARSSSSSHTQCAAVVGTSNSPKSRKYAVGVLPYFSLQLSCSALVSERWMCMCVPCAAASSVIAFTIAGLEVYSA